MIKFYPDIAIGVAAIPVAISNSGTTPWQF